MVFLIDSTFESVDKNDFKRQREFVISLAKSFKIPNNGARVSVVTYGKDARPIVQFKDSGDFDSFLYAMMSGSSRMQGECMTFSCISALLLSVFPQNTSLA